MKGKVVIFCAPSGTGKTTIIKRLLETDLNLQFSVSACSRAKRQEEIEGKDYYFISVNEFRKRIKEDQFIEWQEVYKDQYYGTPRSEIERLWQNDKVIVFDVDVYGGLNLKKIFGDKALSFFLLPPSEDELEARLKKRQTEDEISFMKRIDKAREEMSHAGKFDAQIINDRIEDAVSQAYKAIKVFISQ